MGSTWYPSSPATARTPAPFASGGTIALGRRLGPRPRSSDRGRPRGHGRRWAGRRGRGGRPTARRAESSATSSASASRNAPSRPSSSFLVGCAPAILNLRAQPQFDHDAPWNVLAERRDEACKRLRRPLRACRDRELVAALEPGADLKCCRHSLGGKHVVIRVGVPPKLDLPTHVDDANSEGVRAAGLRLSPGRLPR